MVWIKISVLILLTSWISFELCERATATTTLKLNCNIAALPEHVNETADTREILAVNRCAQDYQNVTIIKKCENLIISKPTDNNSTLYEPVTNHFKNVTYWNVYCAICNYESESDLEYWPAWSQLDYFDDLCKQYAQEVEMNFDVTEMTRNSIRDGLKLISNSSNSAEQLQCSINENWPLNLLMYVVPCLKDEVSYRRLFSLDSCQYFNNNGTVCLRMLFIVEGVDFVMDENNKMILLDRSLTNEFTVGGYAVETGVNNVIYLCIKDEASYSLFHWIEIFVINVSIIFIGIYLIMNFNKKYFQSFPNKIIYSYSVGLLVMYLLAILSYILVPHSCVFSTLNFFSFFFHFFWTMIIALEFCRLTYCTVKKRKITTSAQLKRYRVYCVFGYVIPIALPVIYALILETDGNRCPQIPNHFGIPCEPAENSLAYYYIRSLLYIYYGSFATIVPALLILQSCVLFYITKCGEAISTRIRSSANRNNLHVLMKMAYIMGAHWILYASAVWIDDGEYESEAIIDAVLTIPLLISDFQGIYIFFAFTFKKSMLDNGLRKCGCRGSKVQQSSGEQK